MIDKLQLDEELMQYFNNVIEVRNNFELYKMIKAEPSLDKVNKHAHIFVTVINSLEYAFIMQLYKLLEEKEEKNLFTMIKLCNNNIKHFSNKEKINNELKGLDLYLKDNQGIITNITNMRDKFFAHSDRKYFKIPNKVFNDNSIKNKELEDLIKNIYKFDKSIYANLQPIMIIDWVEEMENEWNCIIRNI